MTETEVTIANGAGLILSLVCSYVPGAKQKRERVSARKNGSKRERMARTEVLAGQCHAGMPGNGVIVGRTRGTRM